MAVYLAGWMVPTMAVYLSELTVVKMAPRAASKTAVAMVTYLAALGVVKMAPKKASKTAV